VDINKIREKVGNVPHMTFEQAQVMRDVILRNRFQNILELGFRHGVSTCYMAGALNELGGGKITTIDLLSAKEAQPNVEKLLADLGLSRFVTVFYEPTSYVWRLMKLLEEDPSPRFDFCYIDGAHDWSTDGFAFFLVDRLLKPGGLVIFDDLEWTYGGSPALRNSEKVRQMPDDEKNTRQVRKVYELLVRTHPAYGEFTVRDAWAYARKTSAQSTGMPGEVRKEIVYQPQYVGLGGALLTVLRKLSS
jgi:predicted O-methyltransferase YrrM